MLKNHLLKSLIFTTSIIAAIGAQATLNQSQSYRPFNMENVNREYSEFQNAAKILSNLNIISAELALKQNSELSLKIKKMQSRFHQIALVVLSVNVHDQSKKYQILSNQSHELASIGQELINATFNSNIMIDRQLSELMKKTGLIFQSMSQENKMDVAVEDMNGPKFPIPGGGEIPR